MSLGATTTIPPAALFERRPSITAVLVTRRALIAAVLAAATVLAVGCTASGSAGSPSGAGGQGNAAASRVYGPGAYQLAGHGRGYSAEVIVKQIKSGVVVLAAGGSYKMSNHLCAPGFSFAFYENGKKQLTWAVPISYDCLVSHTFGDHLVCLSSSHVSTAKKPRTDLIGGCAHPVFPLNTGTDVKLTAQSKARGLRYTVKSVGILLLPRSSAQSEQ